MCYYLNISHEYLFFSLHSLNLPVANYILSMFLLPYHFVLGWYQVRKVLDQNETLCGRFYKVKEHLELTESRSVSFHGLLTGWVFWPVERPQKYHGLQTWGNSMCGLVTTCTGGPSKFISQPWPLIVFLCLYFFRSE